MAYVLSLRPHSPLKRSFSDNPYLQSCSPVKDSLLSPLCDVTDRNASACSLYSLGSNRVGSWAVGNENTPPMASRSQLSLAPTENSTLAVRPADQGSRKHVDPPPLRSRVTAPAEPYSRKIRDVHHVPELSTSSNSSNETMDVDEGHVDESDLFDLYEAIQVPLPEGRLSDNTGSESHVEVEMLPTNASSTSQPFRRWLSTLRRRHVQHQNDRPAEQPRLSIESESMVRDTLSLPLPERDSLRRNSESMSSSMGCVTTMRPASMTVASASIAPRSETGHRGKGRFGNRSSHYSDVRRSLDSIQGHLGPIVDESAWLRSLQRRKIVEELIASEESYIADLKVLINVRCKQAIPNFVLTRLAGLLHDSYCTSHLSRPNEIIHTAKYLSDIATSRGSASRAASSGTPGGLHE